MPRGGGGVVGGGPREMVRFHKSRNATSDWKGTHCAPNALIAIYSHARRKLVHAIRDRIPHSSDFKPNLGIPLDEGACAGTYRP